MMRTYLLGRALWLCLFAAAGFVCFDAAPATAQEEEKPYSITDGKVDWYTYSGYRRYHGECHVCHGPDGLGSSFGPSLVNSLKTLSYDEYLEVVVNGRQNVSQASHRAMPAFGMNPNVMCFVDDIYAYLKARSDGALGRGRPEHGPKPDEARERDNACLGF
ncbi:c-type cytochrome, methanol metabolism-related [Virgifigura deserti]|uniref:c-type cytochrome, methanol metabolism-related n=1 Tax=Virgifigura deserti TaxID=2268457 RepID=UPI003CCC0CEA